MTYKTKDSYRKLNICATFHHKSLAKEAIIYARKMPTF